MKKLDTRLYAYRADLADERLKGRVVAARYVAAVQRQICIPLAIVHTQPATDAVQVTQALLGETVSVFDLKNGWAWIQLADDGYVGYVQHEALSDAVLAPTHRVCVASTFLYPKTNLKSQPALPLSMNCKVCVVGEDEAYSRLATGGFVYSAHLSPLDAAQQDWVAVAELFLNTPYLWGGKGFHGMDCSGLVQVSMQSCGVAAPRDADMQEQALGNRLLVNDLDGLRRGDLVFWDGHVGIMADEALLVHANGHHMMVVREPLRDAIQRIAETGKPVTSIKRL